MQKVNSPITKNGTNLREPVKTSPAPDFFELIPKRSREWLNPESENAVILVPKFGSHPPGRWFMSMMKKPNYHINLDDVGSFVWRLCDGHRTVAEIEGLLSERFGQKVEPTRDRLETFFKQLSQTKAIVWQKVHS